MNLKPLRQPIYEALETAFHVVFLSYLVLAIINEVSNNIINDYINLDLLFVFSVILLFFMLFLRSKREDDRIETEIAKNRSDIPLMKFILNLFVALAVGLICFTKFGFKLDISFVLSVLMSILSFIFLQFT